MTARSDIVGIVRFSMVSESPRGFPSLLEKSLAERESEIFAAPRMSRRFEFLENILLPTMMRQTDRDFRLVFVTTENLPQTYSDRLEESLQCLPQASVLTMPVGATLLQACRMSLRSAGELGGDRWCTFRIDDDDGLPIRFISDLRSTMKAAATTEVVTMVPGIEVIEGKPWRYRVARKPCSGAGLALISLESDPLTASFATVFQLGPHRKVGDRAPLTVLRGKPAYLRLIHESNVSRVTAAKDGYIDDAEVESLLREHFGLKKAALETS